MLPHIFRALPILMMCSSAWASMHPLACECANASTQTLQYTYTAGGQLATIVYPRAGTGTATDTLQYLYNATGQITQLNWNGASILSGITWNALGQPLGWKWTFTDATTIPSTSALQQVGPPCLLLKWIAC